MLVDVQYGSGPTTKRQCLDFQERATKQTCLYSIPYSRKIWWELNLADRLESALSKVLAVRYGIVIRIYACKK